MILHWRPHVYRGGSRAIAKGYVEVFVGLNEAPAVEAGERPTLPRGLYLRGDERPRPAQIKPWKRWIW